MQKNRKKLSFAHSPLTMLSHTPASPSIDMSKPYVMEFDPLYPTSSPAAMPANDTLKTPFPNISQIYEVDDEASLNAINRRDKDTPGSMSGNPQASLDLTDTTHAPHITTTLLPHA